MNKVISFEAHKRWVQIAEDNRNRLLDNGFCINCGVSTFASGYGLELDKYGNIIIEGECSRCGAKMARVVEKDWYSESTANNNGYSDIFNEMFECVEEDVETNPQIKEYISEFAEWLMDSGISEKTILKHMNNVSLYLIDYLQYYLGSDKLVDGCAAIDGFLGDWFIRKCIWSSKTTIKETAAGIKKFYKCMMEHGHVEKIDYRILCDEIKENMDYWLASFDEYMNADFDTFDWMSDFWGGPEE